jgi:hypothetical protein
MSFFEYVRGFYGVGGLYELEIPDEAIERAIAVYLIGVGSNFAGDSVDRENVLSILEIILERSFV